MVGFDADWLAARAPYDEAALDQTAADGIRAWGRDLPAGHRPVVVDLGSGTGVALERVRRWLAPRPILAYAVDRDADLLARVLAPTDGSEVVPVIGDLLLPLDVLGGPPDGTVDLVVGHAIADLLPLDLLAERLRVLLRPGGLAHLALSYVGLIVFTPLTGDSFEADVPAAFHRHMDRAATATPSYGGSTAGRRLGAALSDAGLQVVVEGRAVWKVRASDGSGGRQVLDRLIRYVVEAAREVGGVSLDEIDRWEQARRTALLAGDLTVRVGHRDLLARKPTNGAEPSAATVPESD